MPPKRASRSAAAAEAEPSSVSPSSSAAASSPAPAPLPLSQRSVDVWIAVWFVLFAFSTTFTDLHNFTASVLGVEVSDLKALAAEVRRRPSAARNPRRRGRPPLNSRERARALFYLSLARSPQGKLLWPPRALTALYFQWAETVDPLLYQNPVWWCAGAIA